MMTEPLTATRAMPTGLRCEVCKAITRTDDGRQTDGCVYVPDGFAAAHVIAGLLIRAPVPPPPCEVCGQDAVPGSVLCRKHRDMELVDADTTDADTTDGSDDDQKVQSMRGLDARGEGLHDVPPDGGGVGS